MDGADHIRTNLALWNRTSDSYEELHASELRGEKAMAWGLWRIPESDLRILGDVQNREILEFGCGAARWSIALAQAGARPVGLDFSAKQLEYARQLMTEANVEFSLVEASAEEVPLDDASFDIVFCDWGAMTFADPFRTVPEASRLLRPGGLFAFATMSPIDTICTDRDADVLTRELRHDYFGLHRVDWGDEVNFSLPYGDWVRLFRRHEFEILDLVEVQPPEGATSSYRTAEDTEWARHWPMEIIWRVRKIGEGGMSGASSTMG